MGQTRTKLVGKYGQSFWYDNISRPIIRSGKLARMVKEDGIGGVTSNPTIFMKAIAEGNDYDEDIRRLKLDGKSAEEIVRILMVGDIIEAADILRTVYDRTNGEDGYVSLECNPHMAYDAAATITEAVSLFREVERPNVMIKVPGTEEGAAAVKELLVKGVNINVTLLFSPDHYRRVAEVYIDALEQRILSSLELGSLRSVASFFLSRIDTVVDRWLDDKSSVADETGRQRISLLRGEAAIAVAKVTYGIFRELFFTDRFRKISEKGGNIQRPLWASTSTKDPSYPDVKYVEPLIGPHTVNTLPQTTLDAFRDHGQAGETLTGGHREAENVLKELGDLGLDMKDVYQTLQVDGVKAFEGSYESLVEAVKKKMV